MSLILGLIAAISWGLHDLCVRRVSQTIGIFPPIIAVLTFSVLMTLPVSLYSWDAQVPLETLFLSLLAGVTYGLAVIAHYKAFSIGPIRLVAPIIAAYPILSIAWAAISGTEVSIFHWMAVGLVIAGVGYVAISTDVSDTQSDPASAITWSVLASAGFAITFAIGQAASSGGEELFLLAPTRIAAVMTVLAIAILARIDWFPRKTGIWILATMGLLDTVALAAVLSAGGLANPEYASVTASTFGLITIILAAIVLRERIALPQWGAVMIVFAAIAYLGF